MAKLWLVFGESGSYSDYRAGGVAAFESEEDAKRCADALNAQHRAHNDYKCDKPGCAGWTVDGYRDQPNRWHYLPKCQFAPKSTEWDDYSVVELEDGDALLKRLLP